MLQSQVIWLRFLFYMSVLGAGCQGSGFIDSYTPKTYIDSVSGKETTENEEHIRNLLLGQTLFRAKEILEAEGYCCLLSQEGLWDRFANRLTNSPDSECLLCVK